MSAREFLNPRDTCGRVEAIRTALRALESAAGAIAVAWDAEMLRTSPHLADCVRRVPPAMSAAELTAAQDAFLAAHAVFIAEASRPLSHSCNDRCAAPCPSALPMHVPHGARARARGERS